MNGFEKELLRRLKKMVNSKNAKITASVRYEKGGWGTIHLSGHAHLSARVNESFSMNFHVFANVPEELMRQAKITIGDPPVPEATPSKEGA